MVKRKKAIMMPGIIAILIVSFLAVSVVGVFENLKLLGFFRGAIVFPWGYNPFPFPRCKSAEAA